MKKEELQKAANKIAKFFVNDLINLYKTHKYSHGQNKIVDIYISYIINLYAMDQLEYKACLSIVEGIVESHMRQNNAHRIN